MKAFKFVVVAPDTANPKYTVWWMDGLKPGMLMANLDNAKEADHICVMLAWHYRCGALPLDLGKLVPTPAPSEISK